MRCYYHHDVDAVAVCKSCSRGLCSSCAADVGNGMACRNRCEAEVQAINDIIRRNKTAYEKTHGAYARTAVFYAVVAAVFFVAGLFNWRGLGWMFVPAGIVFALAAYLHFSTGRRYKEM